MDLLKGANADLEDFDAYLESSLGLEATPLRFRHSSAASTSGVSRSPARGEVVGAQDLESSTSYVNDVLRTLGITDRVDLASTDPSAATSIVQAMYALLRRRQRDVESREAVDQRLARAEADLNNLRQKERRLQEQLENAQRDASQLALKEKATAQSVKQQLQQLTAEKEEYSRMVKQLKHREAQFKGEIRKRENELTKVQERLQSVLSDRKVDGRGSITMSAAMPREGKRSTWAVGEQSDGQFFQQVLQQYEQRSKDLLSENERFRELVRLVQRSIAAVVDSDLQGDDSSSAADRSELPVDDIEDELEATLHEKLEAIKEYTESVRSDADEKRKAMEANQKRIAALEKEAKELRRVVAEQDDMLQNALSSSQGVGQTLPSAALDDSAIECAREQLEDEKRLFEGRVKNFEEERARFTKACESIDRERMQLQLARKQLAEEKRSWDRRVQHAASQSGLRTPASTKFTPSTRKIGLPTPLRGLDLTPRMYDHSPKSSPGRRRLQWDSPSRQ